MTLVPHLRCQEKLGQHLLDVRRLPPLTAAFCNHVKSAIFTADGENWSELAATVVFGEINSAKKLFIANFWVPKTKTKSSSSWYFVNTIFYSPDDERINYFVDIYKILTTRTNFVNFKWDKNRFILTKKKHFIYFDLYYVLIINNHF